MNLILLQADKVAEYYTPDCSSVTSKPTESELDLELVELVNWYAEICYPFTTPYCKPLIITKCINHGKDTTTLQ